MEETNKIDTPVLTGEKQDKKKKNLFKKGQSGNPNGRPQGSVSITAAIKAKLLEKYPEQKQAEVTDDNGQKVLNKEKRTYLQAVIDTIFENALVTKNDRTLNQIWAYIDGHPKATIDIGVDKTQLDELTEFFRGVAKPKIKKE